LFGDFATAQRVIVFGLAGRIEQARLGGIHAVQKLFGDFRMLSVLLGPQQGPPLVGSRPDRLGIGFEIREAQQLIQGGLPAISWDAQPFPIGIKFSSHGHSLCSRDFHRGERQPKRSHFARSIAP